MLTAQWRLIFKLLKNAPNNVIIPITLALYAKKKKVMNCSASKNKIDFINFFSLHRTHPAMENVHK